MELNLSIPQRPPEMQQVGGQSITINDGKIVRISIELRNYLKLPELNTKK